MTAGPAKHHHRHGDGRENGHVVDDEERHDSTVYVPTPPDGGWGWVVVFGSFMIHIIADGVTYTFGIFYTEFLGFFGEGKGATSWIASILVGVTLGAGPIASALTNKYGCRAVTIAGAVLGSIGLIASVFSPNIITLYVTIGVLTGLGFGLIYLPAIVSVTCYFEKRRSFATGIAVCGSGIGTFIFAPLTEHLIENYGWKGAMLLISGLVLNCTVFGALFRPLRPPSPAKRRRSRMAALAILSTPAEQEKLLLANGGPMIEMKSMTKVGTSPKRLSVPVSNGNIMDVLDTTRMSSSAYNLTAGADGFLGLNDGDLQGSRKSLGSSRSLSDKANFADAHMVRPMSRKDVFYSGSLLNFPAYKQDPEKYTMSVTHIPSSVDGEDGSRSSFDCFKSCCSKETRDTLHEMMDLTLFRDLIFVLFAISNFCTSIGFNVPYVFITDRAQKHGISDIDSSYLLSVIGIANTVSRVVLGFLSDKPWVNRLYLYNSALTICGIATALSCFCVDYISMAVYCAVFGATAGAYVGLTSVILVDLFGLEKLTNSFGLLLLFQGVASLIGPPIAGELADYFDSYDPGFYVAGVMIAISGSMLFAIPPIKWWQRRRQEAKHAEDFEKKGQYGNANNLVLPISIPQIAIEGNFTEGQKTEQSYS